MRSLSRTRSNRWLVLLAAVLLLGTTTTCQKLLDAAGVGGARDTDQPAVPDDPDDQHFGVNSGLFPNQAADEATIAQRNAELEELGHVWMRAVGRGEHWWEIQPDRDQWDWAQLDAKVRGNDNPLIIRVYGSKGAVYPFGAIREVLPESRASAGADRGRVPGKGSPALAQRASARPPGGGEHQRGATQPRRGEAQRSQNSPADRPLREVSEPDSVLTQMKNNMVEMEDPGQRRDAEVFVKALVERYKDRVSTYQIGNEGVIDPHFLPIAQYTYQWIKEADPEAQVLCTAIVGDTDKAFARDLAAFDRALDEGAGSTFDIANFHYYAAIDGEFEDRLEQRYREYQQVLENHGIDRPIWVTETGSSSLPSSGITGDSSEALQARSVVIRLVVFAGCGAEKVLWHNYRREGGGGSFEGMNLVEENGRRKPAYHTFKLLVDKIGYFDTVERIRADDVRLYRFVNPGGTVALVGWSDDTVQVDVKDHLGSRKALVTHIVETEDEEPAVEEVSSASLTLGPSPVFVEAAR